MSPGLCVHTRWQTLPNSDTDHCYLFPSTSTVQVMGFWQWQDYCASQQPSAYIYSKNSGAENNAMIMAMLQYLVPYLSSTTVIWVGAYYQNGANYWVDSHSWADDKSLSPLSLPINGTCTYWNPKDPSTGTKWSYKSCDDNAGATVCEMTPIIDCNATITTTGPYVSPTCTTPKMADYAMQQQRGYMGIQELITLTSMDTVSCGVACIYFSGCFSFDISISGDCRLLGNNALFMCQPLNNDDSFQHYDMITFPK